jgi:hypothetical protein
MIRTVPQWHQKSHCAVDICVSSLSCSNEKTNDRSIADHQCSANNQRVRSALFICSILLSREEEPKKKVTAIKTGKPTMTDQHLYTRSCTQCGGRSPSRSIKSPCCTLIEFKFEIFLGKNKPDGPDLSHNTYSELLNVNENGKRKQFQSITAYSSGVGLIALGNDL